MSAIKRQRGKKGIVNQYWVLRPQMPTQKSIAKTDRVSLIKSESRGIQVASRW